MAREVVVTSATRGVKPGRTGFQVVVSTRGMRDDLVAALERLAEYRHVHPAGSGRNPVIYSHRIISTSEGRFSVLSRTVDGGADFSSRSNKLAHCVALDEGEVTARRGSSPGHVLHGLEDALVGRWADEPPAQPPPRQLPTPKADPGPCPTWKGAMGDAGWAGVLADRAIAGRPTMLVHADCSAAASKQLLMLFTEAMAFIPESRRWQVTFETLATSASQAVWRGTYVGSPEATTRDSAGGFEWIDLSKPLAVPGSLVSPRVDAARLGRALLTQPPLPAITTAATRLEPPASPTSPPSVPPPLVPFGSPQSPEGDGSESRGLPAQTPKTKAVQRGAIVRDEDSWERRVGHGHDPGRNRWGGLAAAGIVLFSAIVALGVWQQSAIATWIYGLIPQRLPAADAVDEKPAADRQAASEPPPDEAAMAFQKQRNKNSGAPEKPQVPQQNVMLSEAGKKTPIMTLEPELHDVTVEMSGLNGVSIAPDATRSQFGVRVGKTDVGEVTYDRPSGSLSFTLAKNAPRGLLRELRRSATLIVKAKSSRDATAAEPLAWISLANRQAVDDATTQSWSAIRNALAKRRHVPLQSVIDKQGQPLPDNSRVKLLDGNCAELDVEFAFPKRMPQGLRGEIPKLRFTTSFTPRPATSAEDVVKILAHGTGMSDAGSPIATLEYDQEGVWFSWINTGTTGPPDPSDARMALALNPLLLRMRDDPGRQEWSYTALITPSVERPVEVVGLDEAGPKQMKSIVHSGPAGWLLNALGEADPDWLVASGMNLRIASSKISVGRVRSKTKNSLTQVWRYQLDAQSASPRSLVGTVMVESRLQPDPSAIVFTVASKGWGDCFTRGQDLKDLHDNPSYNDRKLLGGPKQDAEIRESDFEKVFFGLLVDAGIIRKEEKIPWANAAKKYGAAFFGSKDASSKMLLQEWISTFGERVLRPKGKYLQFVEKGSDMRTRPPEPQYLPEKDESGKPPEDNKTKNRQLREKYEEAQKDFDDWLRSRADDVEVLDEWIDSESSPSDGSNPQEESEEDDRVAARVYRWAKDMPAAKMHKEAIGKSLQEARLTTSTWEYSIDWSRVKGAFDEKLSIEPRVLFWQIQEPPPGADHR